MAVFIVYLVVGKDVLSNFKGVTIMAKQTYISDLNGIKLFAERAEYTRAGVNIDTKFSEIEQEITAMGAFEVVPLTSGANPVPDVADPKTTVIYLTKESGSAKTDPYTEWIYIPADATKEPPVVAHWEVIGETSIDLSGYKTKQTAVSVTGGTLKGVASMSQNENGEVTLTLNDIQDGTTSQKGVVQLEDSYSSTATDKAATPNAVKAAYDLANGKQDPITFEGTYNATSNKAATESTVSDAIAALDATATSTDGTNVQVQVTQVDGVITDVSITTDNTANATDVQNLTSGKANKVTDATTGNIATLTSEGDLADSGHALSEYKTKQTAVVDPTASGTATEFIATVSQDANGEITATKAALPSASTSAAGITSLSSAHDSSVENVAATPKAVKDAYDLASSKYALPSGGIPSTDMATAVQTSLGLADTALQPVSGATSGNFVSFGSNGAIQDSGSSASSFATAAQGTKADSAIQGVSVANGTATPTALTPDANKVVTVPVATSSVYGVMTYSTIELDEV